MKKRPVVALTGASGYIGSHLLDKIAPYADIVALSRNGNRFENSEHVEWRSCDLFSLSDAERALEGADIAVYLVHSMVPSAKLTQGRFEDMDAILADNFAQAASKQGVKRIIFLSGTIPDEQKGLSRHLHSRLEVEHILGAYGVPVTTLRSGLIVGPEGSSFPVLAKLLKRVPYLCLPRWMNTNTQPIALQDVLSAMDKSIQTANHPAGTFDLGGPEVMTYKQMVNQLSEVMGKNLPIHQVPWIPMWAVKFAVRCLTHAPKQLVYPLIESLRHHMVARETSTDFMGTIPFKEAAKQALKNGGVYQPSRASSSPKPNDVRSVQRLPIPEGCNTEEVALEYVKWLARTLNPWIRTTVDERWQCEIGLLFLKKPLLEMTYSEERSTEDRALYYITGGLLTNEKLNKRGRFEFRKIPEKQQIIAAIHDYMPSIPWPLYLFTQAQVHLVIMWLFRRHLENVSFSSFKSPQITPIVKEKE
ncbi:NAD(P)H-binding protein [Halobacillus salinus]|uniref:NAD-dependent epimerase/dehydratase family protein n=1 Tax=Halobacillus salinus TaxID=192814 RepID=A0A4Z0GZE7_9BACI|nr:NAD(P)H-binding protein [Halobacillus salinus]TGB02886.1 NAD-dependent epimerase/dehydratase family protein [Halobacillus salinus]